MTGGGTIREQGGGENRAQNFETFDFRDEHAEALAGMFDIFAFETEHDTGNRWVTNSGERRKIERPGRCFDRQFGEVESGAGIDDVIVLDGGLRIGGSIARTHGHLPGCTGATEASYWRLQLERFAQLGGQGVGQDLEAFIEG